MLLNHLFKLSSSIRFNQWFSVVSCTRKVYVRIGCLAPFISLIISKMNLATLVYLVVDDWRTVLSLPNDFELYILGFTSLLTMAVPCPFLGLSLSSWTLNWWSLFICYSTEKKEKIACSSINLVRNAKAPKKNLDLRFMSNNQTTLIEDVIRFSNFPQRFLCFIREDCGCYHFKNAQSTLSYADIQGNWKKCPSVELSHGLMKIWQNRAPIFCCSVKGHIFVDLQIQDNFFGQVSMRCPLTRERKQTNFQFEKFSRPPTRDCRHGNL